MKTEEYTMEIYTVKLDHLAYGLHPGDRIVIFYTKDQTYWLKLLTNTLTFDRMRILKSPCPPSEKILSIVEKWLRLLAFT